MRNDVKMRKGVPDFGVRHSQRESALERLASEFGAAHTERADTCQRGNPVRGDIFIESHGSPDKFFSRATDPTNRNRAKQSNYGSVARLKNLEKVGAIDSINMPPQTGLPGHSSFVIRHSSRSGVALIITLIMLAMITVMAVAFLALSRRERASVGQSVSSMDAELMTSAGLERAKAEILTRILVEAATNLASNANFTAILGPGLLVSGMHTNYAGNPQD